jgi:hypothetical protein
MLLEFRPFITANRGASENGPEEGHRSSIQPSNPAYRPKSLTVEEARSELRATL